MLTLLFQELKKTPSFPRKCSRAKLSMLCNPFYAPYCLGLIFAHYDLTFVIIFCLAVFDTLKTFAASSSYFRIEAY